jgi:predicted permease
MGERLFAFCLRFYPRAFLAEYASAMSETFSARLRDLRPRSLRRLFFLLRECASAALGGMGLTLVYALGPRRWRTTGLRARAWGTEDPTARSRSRVERGVDLLANLGWDLRHSARALGRRPVTTAGAVVALGLGIGLATTIFSFVYAAAYRPLPVPGGERILHLEQEDPSHGRRELGVSYHDFQDWRAQQTALEDLAAFYTGTVNLSGDERPERYFGAFMTANALDVLGARPALGRGFLPGEDRPSAPPVIVISHSVWRVRFGGDPRIAGRTVRVNGEPTTIVGVMPEGFAFPYYQDAWVPLKVDPLAVERGGGPGLEVFGRLRTGMALEEARAEFDGISARLAAAYPETNRGLVARVEPYTESYQGEEAKLAVTLFLGFGLAVLLVACFNVAHLLLAQAAAQAKDMAIQRAMGASRRRAVAKVLQQAFLLSSAGAVVGVLIAVADMRFLDRFITARATFPLPFWMDLTVDGPVLLFVLGAVGITSLASGLLPGLRASKAGVHRVLTDASWGSSSLRIGRASRWLVLSQITLTTMLLVLAGHLALQVGRARTAEHAYPTTDVLTARVTLFDGAFPERRDRLAFRAELLRRLEASPGVTAVALGTALPGMPTSILRAAVEGEAYTDAADVPTARVVYASPGFFEAFESPPLQGRSFTESDDDAGAPVAVVNRPYAERFFPDGDPVGRQIRVGWPDPEGPWRTVVGVVPDLDMDGALDPKRPNEGIYIPLGQSDARTVSIAVRTSGDPLAFAPVIRDEVTGLQGDTPVYFVKTLQDAINTNLFDLVILGGLLWALALAAFLLASVGLYGVSSFLASQRTRELGVRIALGATGGEVVGLVMRQGSRQVLLGLTVGVLLAAGIMAVMGRGGMQVVPWSFGVAGAVCVALGATGLAAVFAPAWRATKVDPVEALRAQ